MLYTIPNLSTNETGRLTPEEAAAFKPQVPATASSKAEFKSWQQKPTTNHLHISGVEGEQAGMRVAKGNPAQTIFALIGDWDTPIGWEQRGEMQKILPPELLPQWIYRTFSGGLRAIWILEEPINCWNAKVTQKLMEVLCRDLKLRRLTGGFDEKAWKSPTIYYDVGTNWIQGPAGPLKKKFTQKAIYEALTVIKPKSGGVDISMEVIADAIEKKYPGAWPVDFEIDSRGPRFWDASSGDETAAVVKHDGIFYYSDGGGTKSWADLLGVDWVRENNNNAVAGVIENLWFNGKDYFVPGEDGKHNWVMKNVGTMNRYLAGNFGLSSKCPDGEAISPLGKVLLAVETHKLCDAHLPCVFNQAKVVELNGRTVLNSSSKTPAEPAPDPQEWGDNFPFIAGYIDKFLCDQEQKDLFLSWLSFMYSHAHDGTPHNGQNLFLVGPPNKGKTLMSTRVIGKLMGGSQEASNFLLSKDIFSGSLFEQGIWTVDDESHAGDRNGAAKFSAVLKRTAANTTFECRSMYQAPCYIEWFGRVILTANDDPESLRMLPMVDLSNADKLMILRCSPEPVEFPENPVEIINREIPYFARWLYDYEMPEHAKGDVRFGVRSFCDKTLLEEIHDQSSTSGFLEIIEEWADGWFDQHPDVDEWVGNATQLLTQINIRFEGQTKVIDGVSRRSLGINLSKAMTAGVPWIEKTTRRFSGVEGPRKVYVISRKILDS